MKVATTCVIIVFDRTVLTKERDRQISLLGYTFETDGSTVYRVYVPLSSGEECVHRFRQIPGVVAADVNRLYKQLVED